MVYRFSGDYTDSATIQLKSGQNNNGYVPYSYALDYSPSPHTHTLPNRNGNSNNNVTSTMNGHIPSGNLSLTRNRPDLRQDNGLPNVQGSLNSLPNGLIGKFSTTQKNYISIKSIN